MREATSAMREAAKDGSSSDMAVFFLSLFWGERKKAREGTSVCALWGFGFSCGDIARRRPYRPCRRSSSSRPPSFGVCGVADVGVSRGISTSDRGGYRAVRSRCQAQSRVPRGLCGRAYTQAAVWRKHAFTHVTRLAGLGCSASASHSGLRSRLRAHECKVRASLPIPPPL